MEGLLGLFFLGILIYMVLVDLIVLDFFYNKMLIMVDELGFKLKKFCFVVLVLGFVFMLFFVFWV